MQAVHMGLGIHKVSVSPLTAGVYKMFWCNFTVLHSAISLSFNLTKNLVILPKNKKKRSSIFS